MQPAWFLAGQVLNMSVDKGSIATVVHIQLCFNSAVFEENVEILS